MRFTKEVDIPNKLILEQQENRLVVFAGAGVSCLSPSNLPNFEDLAIRAEEKFGIKRQRAKKEDEYAERIDKYFGRLKKAGHQVHEFAAKVYGSPDSKPNELHELVIGLFGQDQWLRVITTNFDPHLTTVAEAKRGKRVPLYYAPALPPGDSFKGIVYLHGCVCHDPGNLVLTDVDFGRAYLTEGWARRFLIGMFRSNSVLFYGYRHDDPIVEYLARALPPDTRRYAFSQEDESERWTDLGIEAIVCPANDKKEFYSQQSAAIGAWVKHTQANLLDHEERIREIAQGLPPLEPDNEDYLVACLEDVPKLRFFCRSAERPEWLYWLDNNKILESLFDPECKLTKTESLLADWICTRFVCSQSGAVHNLIHKHGQQLNPEFWRRIVGQITHAKERPEPKVLAAWVAILMRDVPTDVYRYHSIGDLLTKCRYPEDKGVAIQLFEYLLSPIVETEPSFYISEKMKAEANKIDLRLRLRGDSHWLDECWQGMFKPKLDELWRTLALIVQSHLTLSYTINESIGHAAGDHDRESWWRSAIEPHEQDKHRRTFDALLDAARDVLNCALTNDPSAGDCLIAAWFSSGVPFLKRIAINGVSTASHWTADEKINWLLEKDLIYHHPYKHEVFQVIAKAFKDASGDVQHRLVERAEKGANLNG